jgi:hypothetical protein
MEFKCRDIVQRCFAPSSVHLWKTFRSKPNTIPVDEQNCSPSQRNRVHLQNGMLFGITTECCSASDRNRVHLRPDSPLPDNMYQTLRSLGAPEECWAIGGRFDGSEVELHKALHESGAGFLLSCILGKLAFVKTEDEEFFLQRK